MIDLSLLCDLRGRVLAAAGEDAELLRKASEGGTLAALFAESSAPALLDLLLIARAQGAAVGTGLLPAPPAWTPLAAVAVRSPSGLQILADHDPHRLRAAAAALGARVSAFGENPSAGDLITLGGLLHEPESPGPGFEAPPPDWQEQLAAKDRRIAELEAELARARGD